MSVINRTYGVVRDIIATTLEKRIDKIRSLIEHTNPVLQALKIGRLSNERKRGVKFDKPIRGGTVIEVPIQFQRVSLGGFYDEWSTLATNIPGEGQTMSNHALAVYEWAQYYRFVGISGFEKRVNMGESALVSLLTHKIDSALQECANDFNNLLLNFPSQTGNRLNHLDAVIPSSNSTGTLGGISRATNSWWRPFVGQINDTGTSWDGRTGANLVNRVIPAISLMLRVLDRGSTKCNVILAGRLWWDALQLALHNLRRVVTPDPVSADLGIESISFLGVPIIPLIGYTTDSGGSSVTNMYLPYERSIFFLNTDVLYLAVHPECNFIIDRDRQPFDRDMEGVFIFWMGQVVCESQNHLGRLDANANMRLDN